MHLLDERSAGLAGLHRLNADNLDGMGAGPVAGSHIAVALGDGSGHGQVAVFAVHVVGSTTRIGSDPKTIVLHSLWALVMDLINVAC